MLPVVKACSLGGVWGTPRPRVGAELCLEPVSEAGVSKRISCGVTCLWRSFLVQLTKAVTFKNK